MADGTRQAVILSGMNTGEVMEVISFWKDTGDDSPVALHEPTKPCESDQVVEFHMQ